MLSQPLQKSGAEICTVEIPSSNTMVQVKIGADLSDEVHLVSFDTSWNQDPPSCRYPCLEQCEQRNRSF